MAEDVIINSTAIKKVLNRYTPERAIAEYIWNGFDAKATTVYVDFEIDNIELDTYKTISITDNGTGIEYEKLSQKFKNFLESGKAKMVVGNDNDIVRGKNGYGRFTFFKFAQCAKWITTYNTENKSKTYCITINAENLKKYEPSIPQTDDKKRHGTTVIFTNIDTCISKYFIDKVLVDYLKAEFAWFLAVKSTYKIIVNKKELDFRSLIAEDLDIPISLTDKSGTNYDFNCKYLRWNIKLNDEYSRFYFLNSDNILKQTKTTTFNKKGDDFWHSMVIVDDFFNEFIYEEDNENELDLFNEQEYKLKCQVFKKLIAELNNILKKKRRPFLKSKAKLLIANYEEENVMPKFGQDEWDKIREKSFKSLVANMYEVEPAIFIKLNKEQKRIFLELLNMIMDSQERNSLFNILDSILELNHNDRKEFSKILQTNRLSEIISTIKIINDRLLAINGLNKIVFDHGLQAGEVKHLQKALEKHYWIFGEEFRLVCAEEVKFEEALKRYVSILRKDEVSQNELVIDHPDKNKEMDLFLTATDLRNNKPFNIVVEIKNPTLIKVLKSKQVTQLEEYMDVILKQDCFVDNGAYWNFFLIGQDFDDIVGRRILDQSTGLILKGDNYQVFVRRWNKVLQEAEYLMKYLLDKLNIERSKLSIAKSLPDVMEETLKNNSAALN